MVFLQYPHCEAFKSRAGGTGNKLEENGEPEGRKAREPNEGSPKVSRRES